MKSLKLFKPARATTLGIVLAWLLSVRPAEAGYTVTLQQLGPDVVATGSGAIDLTGLSKLGIAFTETDIEPGNGGMFTGISARADLYKGTISGPTSFGIGGGGQYTNNASGDMVGIYAAVGNVVVVPTGYVSGTALSDSAVWSGKTFLTLGVTPGTYVWTWGPGANQNFTLKIGPANGPPTVTSNPAAFIASFSARLKGSLNPHGLATTFHFQYGTTTSYGLTTAPQTQTGDTSRPVSAIINSLAAHTTYHFRIVASNAAGTAFGSDRTFTTLAIIGPPVVMTNPAINVTASSATLNGWLDPHGLTTSVYFQYGRTTNYGNRTPNQTKTGNNYQNVLAPISGLSAQTTYHFRIVATNSVGTRYSSDRTFTTQ